MDLFRKILFPTDFSENSQRTLLYALKFSERHNAELIILYSYRLVDENLSPGTNRVMLKRKLEKQAMSAFEHFYDAILKFSKTPYTFLSEVGFITDRIIANVDLHHVDLVLLSKDIQNKIQEKSEQGKDKLMCEVSCPILLIS